MSEITPEAVESGVEWLCNIAERFQGQGQHDDAADIWNAAAQVEREIERLRKRVEDVPGLPSLYTDLAAEKARADALAETLKLAVEALRDSDKRLRSLGYISPEIAAALAAIQETADD